MCVPKTCDEWKIMILNKIKKKKKKKTPLCVQSACTQF